MIPPEAANAYGYAPVAVTFILGVSSTLFAYFWKRSPSNGNGKNGNGKISEKDLKYIQREIDRIDLSIQKEIDRVDKDVDSCVPEKQFETQMVHLEKMITDLGKRYEHTTEEIFRKLDDHRKEINTRINEVAKDHAQGS